MDSKKTLAENLRQNIYDMKMIHAKSQAQRSLLMVRESIMESYIDVLNIRINDLQSGD